MTALPCGGIVASLPTPFADDGSLDTAGLRRLIAFAAEVGADGVLVTALAGEVADLSARERDTVVGTAVEAADGRLPLLVGAWGRTGAEAAVFARAAERAGAAGLVVPIPGDGEGGAAAAAARVAAATALPTLVQDAPGYLGAELGADGVGEVLRAAPNVVGVKVEGGSAAIELLRERLGAEVPLWGGDGGRHLLDCVRLGAVGAVPGVEVVDRLVEVWRDERGGDRDRADAALASVLPLLVFELESLRRYLVSAKHVLHRRGLLDSAYVRAAGAPLGEVAAQQLERHLARALASARIAS